MSLPCGPLPVFPTAFDADCRACPLAETRNHIVNGSGPFRPDLLVIGEAPGADEDTAGTPFVGASGKLLRATLGELGLPPERVYFTNAVKCRPPENRTPTPAEIRACRPWLDHELRALRPRSVLLVGKTAQNALDGLDPAVPVHHAFHPAYVLRQRNKTSEWREQLQRAIPSLRPVSSSPPLEAPPPLIEAEPWLVRPWIAVDTETDQADDDSGGNALGQKLVCFQVSDGTRTALYDADDRAMLDRLQHRRVFVHNAKFDLPLLGIDPRNLDAWDDTLLMAYVLREPEVGLKPLALKHLGLAMTPISKIIGTGKKRIPFSQALRERPDDTRQYALADALATALLAELFTYRLEDDPDLHRYYDEIEKPILPILLEMEQTGITVEPDALLALDAALKDEIAASTASVQSALGVFNLASGPQLAAALTAAGFDLREETPTGKLKTDEAALLRAVGVTTRDDLDPTDHQHQIVAALLDVRAKSKLRTTYVKNLLDGRDAAGRIHARFNQCVTNTNRLSSSQPNLQNIPVRGPIKKTMRRVFRAAPGHVLVKADYSQLEVRIYAHYTREAVLLDAYTHAEHDTRGPDGSCLRCDVHQQVANALGIARPRAKNTLFGAIYGAAPPKLAVTAGVPPDQTVRFLATMRARVPSLLTWQRDCAAELARQGFIATLLGWRGYFPLYWSPLEKERREAVRQAANFPIQGTAAGLVKKLMLLADESLAPYHDARLLLQVHDEVVYEVPIPEARQFAADLEALGAAVGEVCGMTVPLKLDVQIGPNWGDVTDWRAWSPE